MRLLQKKAKELKVAICQSVLRHIPQAKEVLRKMVDSVCEGGMENWDQADEIF